MGAAAWYAHGWIAGLVGSAATVARAVAIGGAITAGLAVLAASAKILRLWEFEEAMKAVISRIRGTRTSG
jgi:hypothetical protein